MSLSTHVLDLVAGRPAAGVAIEVVRTDGSVPPVTARTDAGGRTGQPLLQELRAGEYELRFHVGEHFDGAGISTSSPSASRSATRTPTTTSRCS